MALQTAPAVHPPLLDQVTEETLRRNVTKVLETLAENRYQDSPPARLVAVTKTVSPRVINLLKPMGILDVGENRAQVALPKLAEIAPEFHLHWIGMFQTKKFKYIIDHVCLLHALDRMDLAQEIDRRAGQRGRVLPVLLQINLAREPQKGGMPVEEVLPFLRKMRDFSGLHVEGLMSIMPQYAGEDELRELFRGMRRLFDRLREENLENVEMRELSMGMSRDYRIAAQEGATMVRVGTALYQD